MTKPAILLMAVSCLLAVCAMARQPDTTPAEARGAFAGERPRIIVTTDLGADPDDEQSLVRLLVCANEFDIEGLIVSTGCWKKHQANTDMLDKIVDAYGKVLPNLQVHAEGYPSHDYLKSISVMGQTGYGMGDVGEGKDTQGSELIIAAVDKDDPRPVWVQAPARRNPEPPPRTIRGPCGCKPGEAPTMRPKRSGK